MRGYGSKTAIWSLVSMVVAAKWGLDIEVLKGIITTFLNNSTFEGFVVAAGTLLHYLRDRVEESPTYRDKPKDSFPFSYEEKPIGKTAESNPGPIPPREFFEDDRTL